MTGQSASPTCWWEQPGVLHRVVCDLLNAELTTMRRRPLLHTLPWPNELHLIRDLGADSLELLSLATSLSELLHIHRSGIEDYLLARLEIQDWVSVAYTSLRQHSADITFSTSGSSGTPKRCEHSLASLQQEISELSVLFDGRRRVLSAVPAHHIYGFLFTVLLPQALSIKAEQIIDVRTSSPGALLSAMQPGDLVIGHPDYWQNLARLARALPDNVVGVTSGAPCPNAVAIDMRAAGLNKLVQIFGSSETAGIGWRDDETAPYTCFAYWQAQDDGAALARRMPDGATARFTLQDHLTWQDENHFRPAGRRDQVVQVGGINVFPARAAKVIAQHPAVQDVVVRLMRADEGNRLKAFVVPRAGYEDDLMLAETLAEWASAGLSAAERPATYTFGAALPRQSNGKPADWII
ncbi:AMP-binding protein [Pusillimonas sp. NJUB218]|uniref:AMP-binding protein n=1 Tax=Pusillimonas sp. NJUB218 TaxID=2023230 RepID=UPI000F4BF816|nr:AMP-binding protein [Pusillimonas sp. NJUB218]ROT45169.1 hypothetical protein CHR62_07670 [Pusillimonas sp. NJUB218]